MPESTVEERLKLIEQELVRLKARVHAASSGKNWIEQITGTAKDDPVYDEICRMGREMRDAEEPPEDE